MAKQGKQTSNEINTLKPKNKIYKWCLVPNCKNSSKRTPKKMFINVPKKSKIRRHWLKLCGRHPDDIVDDSTVFFCEDHFDLEKDMANYYQYKMGFSKHILMIEGANPSKFYCQPRWRRKMRQTITSQMELAHRQRTQLLEQIFPKTAEPAATENSVVETTAVSFAESTGDTDSANPLNIELQQCRACAEFTKDYIDVTLEQKPYVTEKNTALLVNNLSVGLDFSDSSLPTTICLTCDQKLQDMYNFVKQIKTAQNSMINVCDTSLTELREDFQVPIPKPDSLFVPEQEFVNPNNIDQMLTDVEVAPKRKTDEDIVTDEEKKAKMTVNDDVNAELMDFIDKNVFYLEPDEAQKSDPENLTHSFIIKNGDGTFIQVVLAKE